MSIRSETIILEEPWDVSRRLSELGLTQEGLIQAAHVARTERNNVTDLHPINAPGTFSYHHGVAAIRREFLGEDWKTDRCEGIESIRNEKLKIKVSFCNVDVACGSTHPKPCSYKGPGAERASGPMLFDNLKSFAPTPRGGYALYYLMVDEQGRVEFSRPVIEKRTFTAAHERIILLRDINEFDITTTIDHNDIAVSFEPIIVRK